MSEIQSFDDTAPHRAEQLILDPAVQEGLRTAFSELDNLYNGIETQAGYKAAPVDKPSITPDGQYIEVTKVATPLLPYGAEGYDEAVSKYHETSEYMIFSFDLADLKDPNFTLRPLDLQDADITTYRGGGIDILVSDDGPYIHLPQVSTDGIRYNGVAAEHFKDFRKRLGIEL